MNKEWENKKDSFEVADVRELKGNFLPMILKKAKNTEVGKGLCVIQSFEPIPLYSALSDLGYEYITEKTSNNEYRVYFYRIEKKEPTLPGGMDVPLKPTAIVNFKQIDDELANIVVPFWQFIWEKENPAIDQKTRYMLSLANGVGGGRYRQATREMIKGYAIGLTTEELDELFSLFVWNQGVGHFASEIGPSPLFGAYMLIKNLEKNEAPRSEIVRKLLEKFGEKNPAVGTGYRTAK
jgi:alkylhydroperoxidase/carboxymuconolactone decarboxylase family protein YurZ